MRQPYTYVMAAILIVAPLAAYSNDTPERRDHRLVEFTYRVDLTNIPAAAKKVALWIPVPANTPVQRLLNTDVSSPWPYEEVGESVYGNRFLKVDLSGAAPQGQGNFSATFRVSRRAQSALRDKTGMAKLSHDDKERYLSPSLFISLDGPVAQEARYVTRGAEKPIDQAKSLYDHIVDSVVYDKSGEGWGRGDSIYACDARKGNCTDFHSLFIGEARSISIPSRFIMGFPLPPEKGSGTIPGYHCWAEFYTQTHGWLPIDASEAFNHPEFRDYLFGGLDANRIQFTLGRDILLPGAQSGAVNFSIYPHVEVDGEIHPHVVGTYSFKDLSSE